MPIASVSLMSLDVGILLSPFLKAYIENHRVETKLHLCKGTGRIQVLIKPRSSPVPLNMEPVQIGVTGWYALPAGRCTTFSIVGLNSVGAFPLYTCASGNPLCTSLRLKAGSYCDSCAFQMMRHKF